MGCDSDTLEPCSIGKASCHDTAYANGKADVLGLSELGTDMESQSDLRSLCSDLTDDAKVCLHHRKYFSFLNILSRHTELTDNKPSLYLHEPCNSSGTKRLCLKILQ